MAENNVPQWAELLKKAVTEPGMIHDAYSDARNAIVATYSGCGQAKQNSDPPPRRNQMTYTELHGRLEASGIDRIYIAALLSDLAADAHRKVGELVFWGCQSLRDDERWHDLDGWPECECVGCGCSDPATTTDEDSIPVCDACSQYTVDSDGDVHCSNMDDVEVVTESCGAGTGTRSYVRLKPPEMPDDDPEGEWACYWETAGDDSHVVSRHGTREEAEQAVAAHDFPRPGDHTQYLCGYVVRELVDGCWTWPDEEY